MPRTQDPGELTPAALERRALAETRAVLRLADEAYAPFSCPASAECCQLTRTGRPPWLWPTEWRLLRAQVKALPPARADGACPFLDAAGARCTVYQVRPFGCRTYFCGRVQGPARQPAERTDALLTRLRQVNLELDADASPRPLLELHRAG